MHWRKSSLRREGEEVQVRVFENTFVNYFYKILKNNDEKQQNHIVFNVFFIILINMFLFFDDFLDYPVFAENQQTKSLLRKKHFFLILMNWDLEAIYNHLMDENKIAIEKDLH